MEDPDQPQAAASAASTTPAEDDQVVVLGSGILGRTADERRTGRYGTVHLTVLDSVPGEPAPASTVRVPPDEDLRARILRDLAKADTRYAAAAAVAAQDAAGRPDNRMVAFGHAPLGAAGTLVARIIHVTASDDDREFGKRHPEVRVPEPGERIALGSGALFIENYAGAPLIGVRPADGRAEDWMDSEAIYRCNDQLVRLEFEMPAHSAPGAAAGRRAQVERQEEGLARPAARGAQLGFPAASPLPAATGARAPSPSSRGAVSHGRPNGAQPDGRRNHAP